MSNKFDSIEWIFGDKISEIFSKSSHYRWPEYPDDDFNITLIKYKKGIIAKGTSCISSRGSQK